ncbi:hypothetical protein MVLG_04944 [Microbotryum lychnidis-dioicae p1A1 Lamole]|uniref:Uncharacterized protein n=1 Tax=Microbotryum lychnidis-dioicae (strain p1A1 Lamole / MvSl-1064) TaxID=683840 RepID=U5HCR8_USTV1|nr:hypothetical protein MVLG_04944 [Microbotryum lychnidis-dioicae p1A1 Lamole]|eukprot:KDE04646.1 hypothetical protein MVLG_04944 [Microbotryum lychnidis-dioicae p1A1 Lamole]
MDQKTVANPSYAVHGDNTGSHRVDVDGRASAVSPISSSSTSSAVAISRCSASTDHEATHPPISCSSSLVDPSSPSPPSSSATHMVTSWSFQQRCQVRESGLTRRKRSHEHLVEPRSWACESHVKSHAVWGATMALLRPSKHRSRRCGTVPTKKRLHRPASASFKPREGSRETIVSVSHRRTPSGAPCNCQDRETSSIASKRIRTGLLSFGAIQSSSSSAPFSAEARGTGKHGTPNGREARWSDHRRLDWRLPLSYTGSFARALNKVSSDKTVASAPKATRSTGLAATVPSTQPHGAPGPDRPYRRLDSATATRACRSYACLPPRPRSFSAPPIISSPCFPTVHSQSGTMALDASHSHPSSSASSCEASSTSTSLTQVSGSPAPTPENGEIAGAHRLHVKGSAHGRSVGAQTDTNPSIPTSTASFLLPPITMATLKELDLHDILQSARLRHDIVFDPNLMFRPNYDGERGERKKRAADRYWYAVSRELVLGCRCTAFVGSERLACVCQSPRSDATEISALWPSRIPNLITELRNIVVSLLPVKPSEHSQEEVMEMLDPAFIYQQLTRGLLDVGKLADYLGVTLKMHCAPMRDHMIDNMARICKGDDASVALGLRHCFEILEMMKLDIANHQLRSLRPYLVRTAVEFERNHQQIRLSSEESERVRQWLIKTSPEDGSAIRDRVSRSVLQGVLGLAFSSVTPSPPQPTLPFTFQLDAFRLKMHRNEATDLTLLYMLMMLFQELVPSSRSCAKELLELRQCIAGVISTANAAISQNAPTVTTASTESRFKAATMQGTAKFDCDEWRHELRHVGQIMAGFATKLATTAVRYAPAINSNTVHDMPTLVESYIQTHVRSHSKVFILLRSRLQGAVTAVVQDELALGTEMKGAPWWMRPTVSPLASQTSITLDPRRSRRTGCTGERSMDIVPAEANMKAKAVSATRRGTKRASLDEQECREKRARYSAPNTDKIDLPLHSPDLNTVLVRNGLTPLADQIRSLGERLAKLTSFHLAVNSDFYQALLKV